MIVVVLYEFAHQLDQEEGCADGAPLLCTRDSYAIWSQAFSQEFVRLRSDPASGKHTLIGAYGATNPAEFFAVVTEAFFEIPHTMARQHPALFEQLHNILPIVITAYSALNTVPR
jgi:Mlc titration factor MtfA (ptsG expression regulator)